MKYDRIVEINKEKCQQNMMLVQKEINRMVENRERITVTVLAKNTGLSRGYFYQNEKMRKLVEDAARRQIAVCNSPERISNIALEEENLSLKMSIRVLELKIKQLERQNENLLEENKLLKAMMV